MRKTMPVFQETMPVRRKREVIRALYGPGLVKLLANPPSPALRNPRERPDHLLGLPGCHGRIDLVNGSTVQQPGNRPVPYPCAGGVVAEDVRVALLIIFRYLFITPHRLLYLMTARTIFYESRRKPVYGAVALMLVVALLLAAGCAEQNLINVTPSRSMINNASSSISTTTTTSIPIEAVITTSLPLVCSGNNLTINSVMSGNPFTFSGTTIRPEGNLVRIWVFGNNSVTWLNNSVTPGILNKITLDSGQTSQLKSGTYYLLFQYPEMGNHFEVDMKDAIDPDKITNKNGDLILNLQRVRKGFLNGLEARLLLEQAINTPGYNERSDNTTLDVEEPWIIINPIQNVKSGTPFTINGTTNLPKNIKLALYIQSTNPDPKQLLGEQSVEFYGSAFSAILDIKRSDDCINTFSIDIPGLDAKSGEYFVLVMDYESDKGNSKYTENRSLFNIN